VTAPVISSAARNLDPSHSLGMTTGCLATVADEEKTELIQKTRSTNVLSYVSLYKDCALRYNIFLRSSSGTPRNERSTNFHESGYVDAMCG
jgi:hypothetical protein